MKRMLALVCILLLAVSVVSIGSAEKVAPVSDTKVMDYNGSIYLLKNGETAKFYTFFTGTSSLYSEVGEYYRDIDFDCDGLVKGKILSGGDWITVTNTSREVKVRLGRNETLKMRTGKVQFIGKKFKATVVFTQYGMDRIISVTRNKKTLTLKFKKSSGAKYHYLEVEEYTADENGNTNYDDYAIKRLYDDVYNKTSYSLKIRKGYRYEFGYGAALKTKWGGYTWFLPWYSIFVDSVTGQQEYSIE